MSFDIKNRMGGIKPTQIDLQLLDQLIKSYLQVNSSDLTQFVLNMISNHDSEHFDVFYRKEEIDAQRNQLIIDINNRFSDLINGADSQLQVLQEITDSLQDPNNGVYDVLSNGLAMRLRKDQNLNDLDNKELSRKNLDVLKSSIQDIISNTSLKDYMDEIEKDGRYYFTSSVSGLPTEDDYIIDIYSSTKNNKKIYTLIASRVMINKNPDEGDINHINDRIFFTQYYEKNTLISVNQDILLPWVRLITDRSAVETARNLGELLKNVPAKIFSLNNTLFEHKLYNVKYNGEFCINMIDRDDLPSELQGPSMIEQSYFYLNNKVLFKNDSTVEIFQQLIKPDSSMNYPTFVRKIDSNGNIGQWSKIMTLLDTDSRYIRFDINNQNLPESNKSNARQNLGLGDSATKNVGTGENNVAAGNHSHVYGYFITPMEWERLGLFANTADSIDEYMNGLFNVYSGGPHYFSGGPTTLIHQISYIRGYSTVEKYMHQLSYIDNSYGRPFGIYYRTYNDTASTWSPWFKIVFGGGFLDTSTSFRGLYIDTELSSISTPYNNPFNISTIYFRNINIMDSNKNKIDYTDTDNNTINNCNLGVFYSRFSGLSMNSQTVNNIRLEIVNT